MAAESTINEAFDWVRDESALEISRESTEGESRVEVESRESTPGFFDSRLTTRLTGTAQGEDRRSATAAEGTSIRDISKVDEPSTWSASWCADILGQIGQNFDMSKLHKLTQALSELDRNTRELRNRSCASACRSVY